MADLECPPPPGTPEYALLAIYVLSGTWYGFPDGLTAVQTYIANSGSVDPFSGFQGLYAYLEELFPDA